MEVHGNKHTKTNSNSDKGHKNEGYTRESRIKHIYSKYNNNEEKKNEYTPVYDNKKSQNLKIEEQSEEHVRQSKVAQSNGNRIRSSVSTGNLLDNILNQSVDTIGGDADITITVEDSPLVPSTSFVLSSDLFKPKGYKLLSSLKTVKNKFYWNQYERKQRFGKLNKDADIQEYHDFEPFPNYLGFYFREIYRNTVLEIRNFNNNVQPKLDKIEENCDKNTILPDMSDKLTDDNKTHVTQSMQGLYYISSISSTDAYMKKKKFLPKTKMKKLAIFDMDETLIHWVPERIRPSDIEKSGVQKTDLLLKFKCSSKEIDYLPVNVRPFIREWILEIKKTYQVIIFTASKKGYADTILDQIDPDGELIEARWYRDSCITTKEWVFIKDLRIFEDQWDMKDMVLIDNAVHSFGFQVNNGIPMVPFYNDKNDREMIYLTHYLKGLVNLQDMRPMLKSTFWIEKLINPVILEEIEGVIEYVIEEIEEDVDDDFSFDSFQKFEKNKGIF